MMARVILSSSIIFLLISLTIAWNFRHNINMPKKHSVIKRSANVNYTEIINFWKKHKNKLIFDGEHKEAVLVMGNTGAGKTTLITALIGRKLRVIRQDGYLIFIDEEGKIGTGTSSKTFIPEVMTDLKKNLTYVDCSGFRDNRNVEYEMSSVYFQNILMNQIKKIKLILVINYDSLKINGNKNDFDDLFEHIGEFIKDISKIHDGIALVATKVENLYEVADNGTLVLTNNDELVLQGIANFLKNKRESYINKRENPKKYKMFVDLIDVLLQRSYNSYMRIALFRQPTRVGLIENLPKTKDELKAIANMAVNNLHYVETNKDDFGFALSESLKNTIDQIVNDIFKDALANRLENIGDETLMHYRQMEEEYGDIELLQNRVSHLYDVFSHIKNVDKPRALFQKLLDAANILNISLSLNNLNIISEDIKKLYFFTTVSNSNERVHMLLLKNKMQNIIDSIEKLKNFYDFLKNVYEALAAFQSQNLRFDSRIINIIKSCSNLTNLAVQSIMDLESIVKEIGSDQIYQKIKNIRLNRFQLKHLMTVFSASISTLEHLCTSSSEQMTVKGYNVRMSDVIKIKCWAQAKIIQIFALNKVFIDCTLDKTGTVQQLIIIAPTWEVVGEPKIILNGKAGKSHEKESAKSSSFNSEKGANGLPGLPGGSAGHFFGVGKRFINLEYLEIRANGGIGGPGQNGGNGASGIPGVELPASFLNTHKRTPEDIETYFRTHDFKYDMKLTESTGHEVGSTYRYDVTVFAKPAIKPSNGGDGGSGGQGGCPGETVINGLGKLMSVKSSAQSGYTGSQGKGGHGGNKTSEGRRLTFNYRYELTFTLAWSASFTNIRWTNGIEVQSGKNGNSGSNDVGKKLPTLSMKNLYPSINSFKEFVRINLIKSIKESVLKSFIYELENDNHIKAHYSTLAFVKEFEGLENQFSALKNEIDLVPFYTSILTRIEEYAQSERNLQNKKVLNYIYTAALTKLFALKKKRKGHTVVDLYTYLNTIEGSVKEIREAQHLQIVEKYRDDYKKSLNKKIQEATDFIQNKIEPEIEKLWDESDSQIKAIIDEINKNRNSTKDNLVSLEEKKKKMGETMKLRAWLLPFKLAASSLSFFGPIGAGVGAAVTSATSIADGMLLDTSAVLGQNLFYSLDPELNLMSRVTEVFDNSQKLAINKLDEAKTKLTEYEKELGSSSDGNKIQKLRKIRQLKTQLHHAITRETHSFADIIEKQKDIKEIDNKLTRFVNEEKDILEKIEKEKTNVDDLKKDMKYETRLRRINDVQSVLDMVSTVFSFKKKTDNDNAIIKDIDNQISQYAQELRNLKKMEDQVFNIVLPDFRQIVKTINTIQNSVNGSSHAKLDITKWTVRTTLKDVKLLLQKFAQKMPFELRNNLERYIDKIDEGFSILIDIYDRIDSYSDSVKQAEYVAHIVSAPMTNIQVTDSELSKAIIDLKLIIQSNILFEKYSIALHAFKQHFYPFAEHVLKEFQLPTHMRLYDTESLRSEIIESIKKMKNHIDVSKATLGEYSRYIHEKKIFNSNVSNSSPFYVWKHDTIKNEVQRLLSGSEILLKADITQGLSHNSIKYNDIGINLKLKNKTLQNNLNSVLENFKLTMTMIGNNYYRCGERYYSISFDDDISISYTLKQDQNKHWMDPNKVYTTIRSSHTFLSPYVMWSIKLDGINRYVSFNDFNVYANEIMDIELFGRGYYIEQNADFHFVVCNESLNTFYDDDVIVKEVV